MIATARLDEKGTARRFDRAVPSLLCAGDAALEVNPDVGRLFLWDRTWMRPGVDLLKAAGPRRASVLGDGNGLAIHCAGGLMSPTAVARCRDQNACC